MIFVGVDPGVHGALAWLDGKWAAVMDIPSRPKGGSGKIKLEIDAGALSKMIIAKRDELNERTGTVPEMTFIMERLATMPGRPFRGQGEDGEQLEGHDRAGPQQSSAGAFSLGDSVGCLRGVIIALGYEIKWCTPITWKRYWGIHGADQKEQARLRALELYPDMEPGLHRKKDHNRAESLLIARYGWEGQITRR